MTPARSMPILTVAIIFSPRLAVPEPAPSVPPPPKPKGLHIPAPAWLTWERVVLLLLTVPQVWPVIAAYRVELHLPVTIHKRTPTPTPTPPAPTPVPVPVPPAPPRPEPVAGHITAALVVDLDAMTPALAVVREGATIRPALQALDASYRTYASSSPDVAALKLDARVTQAGGPPCLVIYTADRTLAALKAPASEAEVVAAVKAAREGR